MRVLHLEAPNKVRLKYLEVFKHQERLNDINKVTRDGFTGCKALSKVVSKEHVLEEIQMLDSPKNYPRKRYPC